MISEAALRAGSFLSEGVVEIAIDDVVIVRVIEPGSVFGEVALPLDQTPGAGSPGPTSRRAP